MRSTFALLILLLASTAPAADWPQFLGPARNGISPETGLMKSWPKDGPKEVWRVKGGVGMSGIAISGGKALPDNPQHPNYPEWLRFSSGVIRALAASISDHIFAKRSSR